MLIGIVRLEDDNDDKNVTELYRRVNSHVMPFQHVKRYIFPRTVAISTGC